MLTCPLLSCAKYLSLDLRYSPESVAWCQDLGRVYCSGARTSVSQRCTDPGGAKEWDWSMGAGPELQNVLIGH